MLRFINTRTFLIGFVLGLLLMVSLPASAELAGCDAPLPAQTVNPETDFADFALLNVAQKKDAGEDVPYFYLETGNDAIDPNSIVLEFDQEVCVNFFYEDAGYQSTLGWLNLDDAVFYDDGRLDWGATTKQTIFANVNDSQNSEGDNVTGGDGVLDAYADYTHAELIAAGFDPVVEAVDPVIDIKDMRKCLKDADDKKIVFPAQTELVFWLDNGSGNVYFTKKAWNADVFDVCNNSTGETHERTYLLGSPNTGTNNCETTTKGFLDQNAIDRLDTEFDLTMSGSYIMNVTQGDKFDHVIVAAPSNALDQWILSWEDLPGSDHAGDMDYNDMTFRIQRQTGGTIQTKSENAIKPKNSDDSENVNAYFTSATLKVFEETPTASECAGKTSVRFRVSANNGASWYPDATTWITDWDAIRRFSIVDGEKILGDSIALDSTGKVYREIGVGLEALNIMGQELIWQAELHSDVETCVPKLYGIELSGQTKSNATISHTSPMPLGNVVYSTNFETPFFDWQEKRLRGHVRAAVLYDPNTAVIYNSAVALWDAGEVVSSQSPDSQSTDEDRRMVYYPIQVLSVALSSDTQTDLLTDPAGILVGDGSLSSFSGTLPYVPAVSTTIKISAETANGVEVFEDQGNDKLLSAQGGEGTINRFTGVFSITFSAPPLLNTPIRALFSYYTASTSPIEFTAASVDNELMALDSANPDHDFDGSGLFNEADGDFLADWVRGYYDPETDPKIEKDWKLGAIDHSTPAVLTAPGFPRWYYGTDVDPEEKQSYLNYVHQLTPPTDVASSQTDEAVWLQDNTERKTVLFVGSRDGMLHAFDAGKYRPNGDYWRTAIEENRGYFVWEDPDGDSGSEPMQPNYGTGKELWSFIPANLVSRLKNNYLQSSDQAMVDASPTIADVRIGDKTDSYGGWKSVLLSAEGNGGNSVFCLDVTNPDTPKFLWEFSDLDLFRSRSSPSVGPIGRVMVDGQPHWAAFFVSGNSNPAKYPSVYVVDIADGSLIDRISLYAPSPDAESRSTDTDGNEVCPGMDGHYTDTSIPCGLGGIPSSEPAIVDIDGNGYIDRMYIGTYVPNADTDLPPHGALFRINLSDDPNVFWTSVSNVIVNTDYTDDDKLEDGAPLVVPNADRWQPVYASPTVDAERRYNTDGSEYYEARIMFGTGDSPFVNTDDNSYTNYYIYSYLDRSPKAIVDPGLSKDPSQVELEWFMALPAGHRVIASAFASARKLYIGTSTSGDEDPCLTGEDGGRLYILNYDGSNVDNPDFIETGNVNSSPIVEDEHMYIKTKDGTKIYGKGTFQNETSSGGPGRSTPTAWRELGD